MLTQIGYEGSTEPMPCRVCGEPFINYETKLCVEHYGELMEIQSQDNMEFEFIFDNYVVGHREGDAFKQIDIHEAHKQFFNNE